MTPSDDEDAVRLTAYFLWEQDGRPDGQHDEYWRQARDMLARQKAYDGWLEDNGPVEGERERSGGEASAAP